MIERLQRFLQRTEVLLALLVLQLIVYWLWTIYAPEMTEAVAYQRF
jgi:hypothetical protein